MLSRSSDLVSVLNGVKSRVTTPSMDLPLRGLRRFFIANQPEDHTKSLFRRYCRAPVGARLKERSFGEDGEDGEDSRDGHMSGNATPIMNPPPAFVPLNISSLATQRSCERKEAATFP